MIMNDDNDNDNLAQNPHTTRAAQTIIMGKCCASTKCKYFNHDLPSEAFGVKFRLKSQPLSVFCLPA